MTMVGGIGKISEILSLLHWGSYILCLISKRGWTFVTMVGGWKVGEMIPLLHRSRCILCLFSSSIRG